MTWQLLEAIKYEHDRSITNQQSLPESTIERYQKWVPFLQQNGVTFSNKQLTTLSGMSPQTNQNHTLGFNGQAFVDYIIGQQEALLYQHAIPLLEHYISNTIEFMVDGVGIRDGVTPANLGQTSGWMENNIVDNVMEELKKLKGFDILPEEGAHLKEQVRSYCRENMLGIRSNERSSETDADIIGDGRPFTLNRDRLSSMRPKLNTSSQLSPLAPPAPKRPDHP